MTNPLDDLQRIMDDKQVLYVGLGYSMSTKGRCYATLNYRGQRDKKPLMAHADTVGEALRDAIRKHDATCNKPAPTLPGMEPLTTRPLLPGMTR